MLLSCLTSCRFGLDLEQGRFSCQSAPDCGRGWECRPQTGGGGLCYPQGACTEESCNGADDDCDGQIDQRFPEQGLSCQSSAKGVCRPGAWACVEGRLECRSLTLPRPEQCDGEDDDCDGEMDEDFDLSTDSRHCGRCGRACLGGAICSSAACHESVCDDQLDNDGDERTDCLDEDCEGRRCSREDAGLNCGRMVAGPADAGPGDAGDLDAGVDAGAPDAGGEDAGEADAGAPLRACVPLETDCSNGQDDDGDGRADCADSDCHGQGCP